MPKLPFSLRAITILTTSFFAAQAADASSIVFKCTVKNQDGVIFLEDHSFAAPSNKLHFEIEEKSYALTLHQPAPNTPTTPFKMEIQAATVEHGEGVDAHAADRDVYRITRDASQKPLLEATIIKEALTEDGIFGSFFLKSGLFKKNRSIHASCKPLGFGKKAQNDKALDVLKKGNGGNLAELIEVLKEASPIHEIFDEDGRPLLHLAAEKEGAAVFSFLTKVMTQQPARLEVPSPMGGDALYLIAALKEPYQKEIYKADLLMDEGARANRIQKIRLPSGNFYYQSALERAKEIHPKLAGSMEWRIENRSTHPSPPDRLHKQKGELNCGNEPIAAETNPDLTGVWSGEGRCECASDGLPKPAPRGMRCGIRLELFSTGSEFSIVEAGVFGSGLGVFQPGVSTIKAGNRLVPVGYQIPQSFGEMSKRWIYDSCFNSNSVKLKFERLTENPVHPDLFQVMEFRLSDDKQSLHFEVSHGIYSSSCWVAGTLSKKTSD
ncbi:MAG: hypothetical protein AB1540_00605 [Bdellovibrionota bacterium]